MSCAWQTFTAIGSVFETEACQNCGKTHFRHRRVYPSLAGFSARTGRELTHGDWQEGGAPDTAIGRGADAPPVGGSGGRNLYGELRTEERRWVNDINMVLSRGDDVVAGKLRSFLEAMHNLAGVLG